MSSTSTRYHNLMSRNGENTSSTTEQSQEQTNVPQGPAGLEQKTIDACIKIVETYRAGKISKGHAAIQLYEAFPAEIETILLDDSYGSYLTMLDNFDRFCGAALQRGEIPDAGFIGAVHDTGLHQQTLGHLWDSVAVLHRYCSDL